MFQAAIIGVNGWAANYLPHLSRLEKEGKLHFAAAVIRNPGKNPEVTENLRSQGVKIYPTQEEMYADLHPDLVCIPTGIEFHEEMTLRALEHDCNVLLEKPAAPSVAAVDRMIKAERRHPGCFAAVGFQHVYDRNIHHFKKSFSGGLGKPQLRIECENGTITWQQNSPWQIASLSGEILESGPYGDPIAQMFDDIADKLNNPSKFCCTLEIAKEHTKIIEKLHRDFSIIPVPAEQVKRIPETGQLIFPDPSHQFEVRNFMPVR